MSKENNTTFTLKVLLGVLVAMLGLSFASVPLYRLFCQETGFAGTPNVFKAPSLEKDERVIRVHFSATTARNFPWEFKASQAYMDVTLGQNSLAFYKAKNLSSGPIIGMAVYNVSPERAAPYFNKVACFCFEQQELKSGQEMDMPVLFYVDPDLNKDPLLNDVKEIILSYTFFEYKP